MNDLHWLRNPFRELHGGHCIWLRHPSSNPNLARIWTTPLNCELWFVRPDGFCCSSILMNRCFDFCVTCFQFCIYLLFQVCLLLNLLSLKLLFKLPELLEYGLKCIFILPFLSSLGRETDCRIGHTPWERRLWVTSGSLLSRGMLRVCFHTNV